MTVVTSPMAHERSLVKNLKDKPFVLIRVHVGGTNAKQLKAVMQKEKLSDQSGGRKRT